MGKPFEKEIKKIPEVLNWAFSEPINPSLDKLVSILKPLPLLVVGSGGSLSGAHLVARIHEHMTGQLATPITPLEFLFSPVDPSMHAVLFITAGGGNKDILAAFDAAIQHEFIAIAVVCAKVGSKISQKARSYSSIQVFEFINPAGKDGFLAVNSLLSSCILIARAYGAIESSEKSLNKLLQHPLKIQNSNWNEIFNRKTIIALGAEWAWPSLVDLESKFTEAALGNVLISDYRNFGHGRHHWFDKKGDESGLLTLETPSVTSLARKITSFLPAKFPTVALRSLSDGPLAGIDLLIQIFYLVNEAGKRANIDPGKPQVPEYGRKIYHISPPSVFFPRKFNNKKVWLERKAHVSKQSTSVLAEFLDQFLNTFQQTIFGGIVFDYDGTICNPQERLTQPKPDIAKALNRLLSMNIFIGVATGRGRSVQESLRNVIEKKYWDNLVIGNYNGSVINDLKSDLSESNRNLSEIIKEVDKAFKKDFLIMKQTNMEIRAKQISITPKFNLSKKIVLERVLEILYQFEKIKIIQSDHSIDIICSDVSKIDVVKAIQCKLNEKILIIGDQGQYGGNDFEMLTLPFSLSVHKVSSSLETCWNLSPLGLRGAEATFSIIQSLIVDKGRFQIDTNILEKWKVNEK